MRSGARRSSSWRFRVLGEQQEDEAHRARRGLEARRQQDHAVVEDLLLGERAPVDRRRGQRRDEVVGGLAALRGGEVGEVRVDRVGLVAALGAAPDQRDGEVGEALAVGAGHAEGVHERVGGHRVTQFAEHLAASAVQESVDEAAGDRTVGGLLVRLHRPRQQRGNDLLVLPMQRRVGLHRDHRARVAEVLEQHRERGERGVLPAVQLLQLGVAGDGPDAVGEPVGPRHRALPRHLPGDPHVPAAREGLRQRVEVVAPVLGVVVRARRALRRPVTGCLVAHVSRHATSGAGRA